MLWGALLLLMIFLITCLVLLFFWIIKRNNQSRRESIYLFIFASQSKMYRSLSRNLSTSDDEIPSNEIIAFDAVMLGISSDCGQGILRIEFFNQYYHRMKQLPIFEFSRMVHSSTLSLTSRK